MDYMIVEDASTSLEGDVVAERVGVDWRSRQQRSWSWWPPCSSTEGREWIMNGDQQMGVGIDPWDVVTWGGRAML